MLAAWLRLFTKSTPFSSGPGTTWQRPSEMATAACGMKRWAARTCRWHQEGAGWNRPREPG
eukprot:1681401-Alexandrium_andersonii.AAC.1